MTGKTFLLQWNINSFYNKLEELQILIRNYNPMIICLQETRFKTHQQPNIKNYKIFRKDFPGGNNACGGVIIAVRNDIPCSEISIRTHHQIIAVEISYPWKIAIACIYIPNSTAITFSEISNIIDQLPHQSIVLGDINAHNTIWGSQYSDRRGKIMESIFFNQDFCCLNNGSPTHFSLANNTFSAIDVSFSRGFFTTELIWTVLSDTHSSDHYPIKINSIHERTQETRRSKWNIKKANWESFNNELHLNFEQETDNINNYCKNITNCIILAAEKSIPKTPPLSNRPLVPWWNENIAKAIKDRKKALKKNKNHPNPQNLQEYKKLKSIARRLIRKSREETWRKFVGSINFNTPASAVWNSIRKLSGRNKITSITYLTHDGNIIDSTSDISDILGMQFKNTSSTQNYSENFKVYKDIKEQSKINFQSENKELYNADITLSELEIVLKNLKSSATGPDEIHNDMLKNIDGNNKTHLLKFLNTVWKSDRFPNQWQKSYIIPIEKPNKDKSDPANYRPISLTSCLSKLLERIISKRLIWFLETQNIIMQNQCGFRKNHSAIDALVHFQTEILQTFANQEHLIAISFDINKAYDMTWKYGILHRIYEIGIRGHMGNFISNFLQNRSFQVIVNGTFSNTFEQENGIPQGSVLSVLLFLIAINSIGTNCTTGVKYLLYADDFIIFSRGKDVTNITNQLQSTLNNLQQWSEETGFTFSTDKTKVIHFSKRRNNPNINLILKGDALPQVTIIKVLGVLIDNKLNFRAHIEETIQKCKCRLNIIKCISNQSWGANKNSLLRIYKALILPVIDYGNILYAMAAPTLLKKLETIQNTAIRISSGAHRTSPITSLQIECSIPPLNTRRDKLLMKYAYKIKSIKKHLNYNILWNNTETRTNRNNYLSKTVHNRTKKVLTNLEIEANTCSYFQLPPSAFWILPQVKIDLQLSKYIKDITPKEVYKTEFSRILESYNNHIIIYTDGSAQDYKAAFAVVSELTTIKHSIPPPSTIYSAELNAILCSLNFIKTSPNRNFLICSDSLSALQSLTDPLSENPIIQKIQNKLQSLSETKDITFLWTPGHVGIKGNEKADEEANHARNLPPSNEYLHTTTDEYALIKCKIFENWQLDWTNTNNNFLRKIKNTTQPWPCPGNVTKKSATVMTRLRIGHTRLTHDWIIKKTQQPTCETCNTTIDVEHVLLTCQKYRNERITCNIKGPIEQTLCNEQDRINNLLKYLKKTKLIDLL